MTPVIPGLQEMADRMLAWAKAERDRLKAIDDSLVVAAAALGPPSSPNIDDGREYGRTPWSFGSAGAPGGTVTDTVRWGLPHWLRGGGRP